MGFVVPHAVAWTPNSITGIVEYWDYSDTSKINDTAGVVNSVAGQKGVYTLSQSGSPRPITNSRNINGLNVLDFDGVNDVLVGTITALTQPFSVLLVYQNDVASGDQRVFDSGSRALYDAAFASSSNKRAIYANSTVVAGATAASTNAEAAVIVFNGASSVMYLNNVSEITGNPGANGTGTAIYFGTDPGALAPFDGRMAFGGLVSGAISSGDRALFKTWCSRWGI